MSLTGGTDKIDLLTGGQQKLLKDLINTVRSEFGQGGPVYEGEIAPGATDLQRMGFNLAGQDIAGLQPALSSMLSGFSDPSAVQQYYQQAVAAPAQAQFQDIMRQVGGQFGGTYGQTGAVPKAMSDAGRRFATDLSSQLAGLQFNERQQALNRQQAAVPLALGARQSQLSQLLGAGGAQRAIQGQQNQEALSKWNMGQAYNNPWVTGFLSPALNTQAFGYANEPGTLGQIGQAVGGVGQILGGLGTMGMMPMMGGMGGMGGAGAAGGGGMMG
jgi:hypothetical protein